MKLPGVVYSLIVGVATWTITYMISGNSEGLMWASTIITIVPIILHSIDILIEDVGTDMTLQSLARSLSISNEKYGLPPSETKFQRWLLG